MVSRDLLEQLKQKVDQELARLYELELGSSKKAWHLRQGNELFVRVLPHIGNVCGKQEICRQLTLLYFHWTTGLMLSDQDVE